MKKIIVFISLLFTTYSIVSAEDRLSTKDDSGTKIEDTGAMEADGSDALDQEHVSRTI